MKLWFSPCRRFDIEATPLPKRSAAMLELSVVAFSVSNSRVADPVGLETAPMQAEQILAKQPQDQAERSEHQEEQQCQDRLAHSITDETGGQVNSEIGRPSQSGQHGS